MKVSFFSKSGTNAADFELPRDVVLLHGEQLDDRGKVACGCAAEESRLIVRYSVEEMTLTIGGETKSGDLASEMLRRFQPEKVVLEATTLGFAELFCATNGLLSCGATSVTIIYVEPEQYLREKPGGDQFVLSEPTRGYAPIPNSIVDLTSDDIEAGVFFLGFEPERLDRALEEHQMISSKDVKLVFGIPAFHPGWELNAIIPHLPALAQHRLQLDYCSANDPEAAFECLERTRATLAPNKRMFIAPIGPKPCGIAAAIFSSVYVEQVGLLFDHPLRKPKRSSGSNLWHQFTVRVDRNVA